MIISCIGDSLTEGDYGIKGVRCVANVHSENYPFYLSKLFDCEVRNFGKCGYRSSDILAWYEGGNVDVTGSDFVLIMLGTNGGQSETEDTPDNLAYYNLIDRVRADAPGARIVLIAPPNATVNPEYSNCGYMPQVAQAQAFTRLAAAKTRLDLIDPAWAFPRELEYIYQPNDGLHFGKMGYMLLAQLIYGALAKYRTAPYHTLKTDCKMKLVAHRGLSGLECENTAASFTAAGNHPCYWGMETDVWFTKDGVPVCSHDKNTGRVCNEAVTITETDFADLRKLVLNDVDRATPCAQYVIPTLEEYIRVCKKYSKHAVTELKDCFTLEQIKQIIAVFEKYDYLNDTTFIAFGINNLDLVRKVLPEQDCQYLIGSAGRPCGWYTEMAEMLEKRHMDLDSEYTCIDKAAVDCFHAHGVKVNCWTVDNPETAKYLEECGVDMITTNILERGN